MMFGHRKNRRLVLSLTAIVLALALLPLSVLAVTEDTVQAAPEADGLQGTVPFSVLWPENDQILPYEEYMPERGTVPEADQYHYSRLSDGELARYRELLGRLENGEISLEGIPSVANRLTEEQLGVYPLKPEDFAGETFYVILPGERLDDSQLLSLIASFRDLDISFDPDSLTERNCTRKAYVGSSRYLDQEEQARQKTLQAMIVRGTLTRDDIAPGTVCQFTDPVPGYGPFLLYPYRRLTDDELAAFLFADHSAWETDPDQINRLALQAARKILRMPLSMSVTDEKMTSEENRWKALAGNRVNRYELFFETADSFFTDAPVGELADLLIWMLEGSGQSAEIEGLSVRYWVSYPADEVYTGDNSEACIEAADLWARNNLALPEDQLPRNWTVSHRDSDTLYLNAETAEWEFYLWVHESDAQISVCYMWNKAFRDYSYAESYDESTDQSGVYLPYPNNPSGREPVSEEEAARPLEMDFNNTVSPWLTDRELARIRVLMAAVEAGEMTYTGPSIVNIPYADSGAAVYPLNPEDYNGQTFYVFLPDSEQLSDDQLLALIFAFKELGISFDPDSLSSMNCCRHCNVLENRYLSEEETARMNDIREKILSGEITVADSAASTPVMIVSKTTLRTWGTDTKQFRFYPYRKLTDDEITAFLFAEIRTGSVDPESLRTSALLSATDSLHLSSSFRLNDSQVAAMDFYGKNVTQYTNEFLPDNVQYSTDSPVPLSLTVKHMQESGKLPELSGIRLEYAYTSLNAKVQSYDAGDSLKTWIAAAEQWAKDTLRIPVGNTRWTFVEAGDNRGPGERVQLRLLLEDWDIRLWIYQSSLQPDECFLYTRKWYHSPDGVYSNLANGYFF